VTVIIRRGKNSRRREEGRAEVWRGGNLVQSFCRMVTCSTHPTSTCRLLLLLTTRTTTLPALKYIALALAVPLRQHPASSGPLCRLRQLRSLLLRPIYFTVAQATSRASSANHFITSSSCTIHVSTISRSKRHKLCSWSNYANPSSRNGVL